MRLWEGRARVNLAVCETRYEDIQIDFNAVNLNERTKLRAMYTE